MTMPDGHWRLHRPRSVPYWTTIKLLQTRPRQNKSARQSRNVLLRRNSSESFLIVAGDRKSTRLNSSHQINPLSLHDALPISVHFSGKHVYAQVIDDDAGRTLAAASTTERSLLDNDKAAANKTAAEQIGKAIAERSLAKKLERVVFDRGGRSEEHTSELQSPDQPSFPTRRSSDLSSFLWETRLCASDR